MPTVLRLLNSHPSPNFVMIVTAPRSPLAIAAGIIGMYAEHPIENDLWLAIARSSIPRICRLSDRGM
jgi:hypothetical protein